MVTGIKAYVLEKETMISGNIPLNPSLFMNVNLKGKLRKF